LSKKEVQFHDYHYMIRKLRSKGMIIDSNKIAIELLQSIGYYNLINRYKSEFYLSDKKEYKENVHIEDLYYYHRIEDDLRNILFQFAIKLEQKLKESMAFSLSKKFGVERANYLNPYNYRNKNKAIRITKFINNEIEECKDNPTNYYKVKYDDVPPWIMFSNITFGQTRMLFSIFPKELTEYVSFQLLPIDPENNHSLNEYILDETITYSTLKNSSNTEIKKLVIKYEDLYIEFTRNIISLVHDFRNNLAHGNRLIHFKSHTKLRIKALRLFCGSKVFSDDDYYDGKLCSNDLFALMVSLIITLDKYDSIAFLAQLESWEKTNTATAVTKKQFYQFIDSCELPNNFLKRLQNINIEKTNRQKNAEFKKLLND